MFARIAAKVTMWGLAMEEVVSNERGDTNLVSIGLWIGVIAVIIAGLKTVFESSLKSKFSF